MSNKKRTYASNTLLYTLFVVGGVILLNLISTRVFGRLDLTEKKIYTLSSSSKDLVKKLVDPINVKAFISKDLPPEIKAVSRYVRDQLDEYKNASGGKFRWEAIDPGEDKKIEEEASRCKVQKVTIQVMRNSKFELGAHYMGLCLQYGDKFEAIPQIPRTEGLEYQISSLIKKLTVKKKKIAFTTGHGEFDLNQGFQAIKQDVEQEFDVTSVNPSSAEIAADVDVLIVGGPREPMDEKGQREIDRFIMTGKGAVILSPSMVISSPGRQQGMMGGMGDLKVLQSNDTGLGKLLETYGFKIGPDVVADLEGASPGVLEIGGGRRALVTAPFFVGVNTEKHEGLTLLEGVRSLVFPFSNPVELVGPLAGNTVPAGGKLWKLAASSKNSWLHAGFLMITAEEMRKITPGKDLGSRGLAYAYQGPLKSAFVAAPAAGVSGADKPSHSETAKPVRIVVLGTSDFAGDEWTQLARFLPVYGAGAQLLFNAMGWIGEDEALIPLRSKNMDSRQIEAISEAKASAYQWGNVLGLPLLFCLYGIARWRLRKAARINQKL
jgi:gliding-associated putative ABC transporter substrate-binding component GldG